MRDKFNVNNNYILTSYIGCGLVDYNTAHNILIISLYTISISTREHPHLDSKIYFYKGEPVFLHLFCTETLEPPSKLAVNH